MVSIRPSSEEDVPRIVDLYRQLAIHVSGVEEERSPSPDDYRQVFAEICADPRHEILVAECDGKIVGTVVLLFVPELSHAASPWALVENLVVDSGYRQRGIGRMMLDHVITRAREIGCNRIQLCSDRRRDEAHRLYEAAGFEALAYGFRIWF